MKNWECGSCEGSEAIAMRDIFAPHEYFIKELKVGAILQEKGVTSIWQWGQVFALHVEI
jgi:hypothetical protein